MNGNTKLPIGIKKKLMKEEDKYLLTKMQKKAKENKIIITNKLVFLKWEENRMKDSQVMKKYQYKNKLDKKDKLLKSLNNM